ncbi:DUF2017 domain-containing protein [Corynebacterium uterequi]|uniref:Putative DUF2017 family protein n=1 Tax=Corynebacterium uterequi TaxID=1072256 RepID=A0A0G3HEN2_9CORY|nr:DUF2017 domain-containing protein [Corynebacterium uterequi]AKK11754.1 putative DUF2017 family protein [Corynebacterium uterequi]
MIPWKAKRSLMRGPRYVTTLEPIEREVLGNVASYLVETLIQRARSAPRDELADMMGMASGHKEAPADPALARLLPDFELPDDEEYDGDNSFLRCLHENDIISAKLTNLQVITEQIGADGSVAISLTPEEAGQFVAALNDVRLFVVSAQPGSRTDEQLAEESLGMPRDTFAEWLAFCQDSLLEALIGD